MALYVVALVLAVFAGIGVERLWEGLPRATFERVCLAVGGGVVVVALAGGFGAWALDLARSNQQRDATSAAFAAAGAIRWGAAISGLALLGLGLTSWGLRTARLPRVAAAGALLLLIGGDLVLNARPFWHWVDSPRTDVYAPDAVTTYLASQPQPLRVLELSDTGVEVYGGDLLMDFGIPQLLGHHGNQLDAFNQLMGGKNVWRNLLISRRLWDLYAVDYVLLPAGTDLGTEVPAYRNLAADFDTVMASTPTARGRPATLLRRRVPSRYARLVPGAVTAEDERAIAILADPRQPVITDRLVLLAPEAGITPERLDSLPLPSATQVSVESWAPGEMRLALSAPAERAGYVLVAENWYPGWIATVDDATVEAVRGNVSQIVVPVPAGASTVTLRFTSPAYQRGLRLTWASMGTLLVWLLLPPLMRRRRRA